jgi:hypothetical protein
MDCGGEASGNTYKLSQEMLIVDFCPYTVHVPGTMPGFASTKVEKIGFVLSK